MKRVIALLLLPTLLFAITACSAHASSTISVAYDRGDDEESTWNSSEMSYITLRGNSITTDGGGTVIDGNKVAITSAGTYFISGTLEDGQIIVRSEDEGTVTLILYGVDITCSTSSPLYVFKANKTVITLAEGTENYVTDGESYIFADSTSDEPNAAIFSKDDLTINGSGSLMINANYNNGIQSKDDLKITGGNIIVNAANDGIKGRDSIAIKNANISVNAGGDGMQSTNDANLEKGNIAIESGVISITAGEDGIQAENSLAISGGTITISSGGGSINSSFKADRMGNPWDNRNITNKPDSSSSSISAKGLKAAVDINISGGTVTIDSLEDAINSNESLTIRGGTVTIASGDDGIHADSTVEINGGDISITKCYEGIESAAITISDGSVHLVSSDDGINVIGGNEGFPMMGPPGQNVNPPTIGQPGQNASPPINAQPGQDNFSNPSNNYLDIRGGYIAVDALGDGIDVNGTINMTGGVVIINGPTSNNNGALDHSGFKMVGGFLVAVGSSGMAEAPSTSSTQYSVKLNLTSSQPANTIIHFETAGGEEILTFVPTKTYQSVVLSSPKLKNGSTYIVYCGGNSTGKVTDGIYSGGEYTAGTQITSFTISSVVTSAGSASEGPGGNIPPSNRRR